MSKNYSNKTVLITGATGQIGSHIVDSLMKNNSTRVIVLGRNEKKIINAFSSFFNNDNFMYIVQDVSEPIQLKEKVDYIFHAAGPMDRGTIDKYPIDVIEANINGTINCLKLLMNQGFGRLVLFSSITVYGNNTKTDITLEENATSITGNINDLNACYFESKRMSEVITNAYVKQCSVDAVIARFSTVFGNTRFLPETAFFEFARKALNGEDITIKSSSQPKRDNIYIDDAVKGVLLIGEKGLRGEAYNISSNGELGNYASIVEIARYMAELKKVKVVFSDNEADSSIKPGVLLNNDKLRKLGWILETSLRAGIEKTLADMEQTR